ncbi:MAG: hypothetical protein J6S21_00750 [Victivallales bacterium]|nr:hypothetical protein [Victivallales bacterium]
MRTPAKINLYLTVGDERPWDGRHEIRTIFLPMPSIADEVTVTPGKAGEGITLACTGMEIDGAPQDNLVCRAVRSFCEAADISMDWHISLEKNIPVSAGLGGGSSDAAAALLEMRRVTGIDPGLPELAVKLGADVPFFLNPVPALAEGIGEKLTPLPQFPPYDAVVVSPGFPSPVAWAYKHWMRPEGAVPPPWPPPAFASFEEAASYAWNDLGFALCRKFPVMEIVLESLREAGASAAIVAGSGACLLGLCPPEKREEIRAAAAARLAGYSFMRVI